MCKDSCQHACLWALACMVPFMLAWVQSATGGVLMSNPGASGVLGCACQHTTPPWWSLPHFLPNQFSHPCRREAAPPTAVPSSGKLAGTPSRAERHAQTCPTACQSWGHPCRSPPTPNIMHLAIPAPFACTALAWVPRACVCCSGLGMPLRGSGRLGRQALWHYQSVSVHTRHKQRVVGPKQRRCGQQPAAASALHPAAGGKQVR